MIDRNYMLSLEGKLLGFHIRLKEIHFSAESMNLHKLTDEFDGALLKFDDAIMENLQPLPGFGTIKPGNIEVIMPEDREFKKILVAIRGLLSNFKTQATDTMYTGANSIVDGFFAVVNKYIYLAGIIGE